MNKLDIEDYIETRRYKISRKGFKLRYAGDQLNGYSYYIGESAQFFYRDSNGGKLLSYDGDHYFTEEGSLDRLRGLQQEIQDFNDYDE